MYFFIKQVLDSIYKCTTKLIDNAKNIDMGIQTGTDKFKSEKKFNIIPMGRYPALSVSSPYAENTREDELASELVYEEGYNINSWCCSLFNLHK